MKTEADISPLRDGEDSSLILVDVRGKRCPIPMMRTRAALKQLSPGSKLHVVVSDPDSVEDFRMLHSSGACTDLAYSTREENGRTVYDFFITR